VVELSSSHAACYYDPSVRTTTLGSTSTAFLQSSLFLDSREVRNLWSTIHCLQPQPKPSGIEHRSPMRASMTNG